jgi:Inner membrane component of T3SS, cytoplasmic domain
MADRPKIVLDEDDFDEEPSASAGIAAPNPPATAAAPVQRQAQAPSMPLPAVTRGVPKRVHAAETPRWGQTTPATTAASWLTSPGRALLVASAVGVVLAWGLTEAFGIAEIHVESKTGADAVTGLWTGVVGVMFGGTLLSFDSAVAGAWDVAGKRFVRAAAPMVGAAFVAGYLGNVIFLHIVQAVAEEAFRGASVTDNDIRLYLARGLGWALFGAGIGGTIGLLNKSKRQAINGALGGALGGAAGGLVFQFVEANVGASVGTSRLLGLIGIGALIALATRAVETARREAWLQVLSGGMAGKEFILYHAVTRLGSTPECEIFLLKDPAVAKVHAQIEDRGTQRILTAMPDAPVFVNQTPVNAQALCNGDQIQVGNTILRYSERAIATQATYG